MIWNYNKAIGFAEKFVTFAFFAVYAYLLFNNLLTDAQWQLVSSSSTGLGFLSKCPQIIQNWRMQSTGQMAFLTFLLTFVGSLARLGTVLHQSDDFFFRLQYITGSLLNTIIIIQFGLYWNVAKKVDASSTLDKNKSKREWKNYTQDFFNK